MKTSIFDVAFAHNLRYFTINEVLKIDEQNKIYAKIDKKIEKAKEKCENTSELRDKRGELYDVIEGNADKIDT